MIFLYIHIPISFFIFLDSIIPNGSKTNKFKSATQKYSMLPTYQKVCRLHPIFGRDTFGRTKFGRPYLVQPKFGPVKFGPTHFWSNPFLVKPNLVEPKFGPAKFGRTQIWSSQIWSNPNLVKPNLFWPNLIDACPTKYVLSILVKLTQPNYLT